MTSRRSVWRVGRQGPHRLDSTTLDREVDLEGWIEADPYLVGEGLRIVGRQVQVEGGVIDLLGVDTRGRWLVIEVKRDALRRRAVGQALDYASSIADMAAEDLGEIVISYLRQHGEAGPERIAGTLLPDEDDDRDVAIAIVGTAVDAGLERITSFLSDRSDIAITVVTLDVFDAGDGKVLLVRDSDESEPEPPEETSRMLTVEELLAEAKRQGIGTGFKTLIDAAERNGLYPRPYRRAIMCTPDTNRSRLLYVFQNLATEDGLLRVYPYAAAFAEFFPVSEEEVEEHLGLSEWQELNAADAKTFGQGLDDLFRLIAARRRDE